LLDAIGRDFLTQVYPLSAGIVTLLLLLGAGGNLVTRRKSHTIFFDSEREVSEDGPPRLSNLHYLAWLAGMLGAAALIGFVLAVAGFIFVFLTIKARLTPVGAAVGAASLVALLSILGHFLVLEYPGGVLQNFVAMPWPLN
jgi:hypothetical protein